MQRMISEPLLNPHDFSQNSCRYSHYTAYRPLLRTTTKVWGKKRQKK